MRQSREDLLAVLHEALRSGRPFTMHLEFEGESVPPISLDEFLSSLGIVKGGVNYQTTVDAIMLVANEPQRAEHFVEGVTQYLAGTLGVSHTCIEHRIYNTLDQVIARDPECFVRSPVFRNFITKGKKRPTPKQFVLALAYQVRKGDISATGAEID